MRAIGLFLLAACLDADTLREVDDRMHERYGGMRRIEQAVVTSNLTEIKSAAHSIAALDEPEALPKWQPYFAAVRSAARDVEASDDIVAAARNAAQLARQCARCHQAIGANITFRGEPRPDSGLRLRNTMAGHQWAAARMWEGLIGPNEERWTKGADLLGKAPLGIAAESSVLGIADDVAWVRLYATRARKVTSQDDRAQLFGQLLATCASCHATIRDR